jgi:hypothetical protein
MPTHPNACCPLPSPAVVLRKLSHLAERRATRRAGVTTDGGRIPATAGRRLAEEATSRWPRAAAARGRMRSASLRIPATAFTPRGATVGSAGCQRHPHNTLTRAAPGYPPHPYATVRLPSPSSQQAARRQAPTQPPPSTRTHANASGLHPRDRRPAASFRSAGRDARGACFAATHLSRCELETRLPAASP